MSANFNNRVLTGHLDLSDFVNLEILYCVNNQLTSLNLEKNKKLETVWAFRNKIKQDLKIFSHLTKLKELDLGDKNKKFNDFYGSLKSLENCKKLEYLCIGQCDQITKGLEYLPSKNLYWFGCQGTVFTKILKPYAYNVEAWQKKDTRPREVLKDKFLFKKVEKEYERKIKIIKKDIFILYEEKEKEINYLKEKLELECAKEQINSIQQQKDKEKISNLEDQLCTFKREQKLVIENMERAIIEQERANWEQEISKLETQLNNNLNKEKTQIKNQLTKEKTAALKNLEQDWQNWEKQERENREQELRNWEKERKQAEQKLTAKIASLEKSKAEIQKEILIQKEAEKNQLRDKVNKKLEKGGLFKPNERGQTLEQATENLLEKQAKLENEIQLIKTKLAEEKENYRNEKEVLKEELKIKKIIDLLQLFYISNYNKYFLYNYII